MKFLNYASLVKQIDCGASASTYTIADTIDGGTA